MKYPKHLLRKFFILYSVFLVTGCAGTGGANYSSTELGKRLDSLEKIGETKKLNPKHGDIIWGPLKIGMSPREVLSVLPKGKFDDNWSSGGIVAVMAEGGIFATDKIKVVSEIDGPYNSPSNLYCLFDSNGRLEGIVLATFHHNLPKEVKKLYGTIGFNLPEYKEAAKILIKSGIPELGKRIGAPAFGKEKLDSLGSVGVATAAGARNAIGFGFLTPSLSPATIVQLYERDGYQSMLSIRTIHNGLYNVYAATAVMMFIRARSVDDEDVLDVE
jgi:hypothetical protein